VESALSTPCPRCGEAAEVKRGVCMKCGAIRDLAAASAPGAPSDEPTPDEKAAKFMRPFTIFFAILFVIGVALLAYGLAQSKPALAVIGFGLMGSPFGVRSWLRTRGSDI
jgi:hypothetical protein